MTLTREIIKHPLERINCSEYLQYNISPISETLQVDSSAAKAYKVFQEPSAEYQSEDIELRVGTDWL